MKQTSLNIGTIGQKLESARQSKGVSVSEAGQATKILGKFIEAMEADDFGVLSAPVYAKSFIKMYAKYLGIEPKPLVDEYVEQYAPKTKMNLTDEVRQNITTVDSMAAELPGTLSPAGGARAIFGNVNQAIAQISLPKGSPRILAMVGGGVLVSLIILLGVTQCSDDEAPAAAGGAASVEHQLLYEGAPDAYLVKPGVIEVEK